MSRSDIKAINNKGPADFEISGLLKSLKTSMASTSADEANAALQMVKSLCEGCDQWIEPYMVSILPFILDNLAAPETAVAAEEAGNAILHKSNALSVRIINSLLCDSLTSTKWQIKKGALVLFGDLAQHHPALAQPHLFEMMEKLKEMASDEQEEVREQTRIAFTKITSTITNDDIIPIIPRIVAAYMDPVKLTENAALDALMGATFDGIEPATLGLVVPFLLRVAKGCFGTRYKDAHMVLGKIFGAVSDTAAAVHLLASATEVEVRFSGRTCSEYVAGIHDLRERAQQHVPAASDAAPWRVCDAVNWVSDMHLTVLDVRALLKRHLGAHLPVGELDDEKNQPLLMAIARQAHFLVLSKEQRSAVWLGTLRDIVSMLVGKFMSAEHINTAITNLLNNISELFDSAPAALAADKLYVEYIDAHMVDLLECRRRNGLLDLHSDSAQVVEIFYTAAEQGFELTVSFVINHHPGLAVKVKREALRRAVRAGFHIIVQALLTAGVGLLQRQADSAALMTAALQCGVTEVARLLVEKGAELDSADPTVLESKANTVTLLRHYLAKRAEKHEQDLRAEQSGKHGAGPAEVASQVRKQSAAGGHAAEAAQHVAHQQAGRSSSTASAVPFDAAPSSEAAEAPTQLTSAFILQLGRDVAARAHRGGGAMVSGQKAHSVQTKPAPPVSGAASVAGASSGPARAGPAAKTPQPLPAPPAAAVTAPTGSSEQVTSSHHRAQPSQAPPVITKSAKKDLSKKAAGAGAGASGAGKHGGGADRSHTPVKGAKQISSRSISAIKTREFDAAEDTPNEFAGEDDFGFENKKDNNQQRTSSTMKVESRDEAIKKRYSGDGTGLRPVPGNKTTDPDQRKAPPAIPVKLNAKTEGRTSIGDTRAKGLEDEKARTRIYAGLGASQKIEFSKDPAAFMAKLDTAAASRSSVNAGRSDSPAQRSTAAASRSTVDAARSDSPGQVSLRRTGSGSALSQAPSRSESPAQQPRVRPGTGSLQSSRASSPAHSAASASAPMKKLLKRAAPGAAVSGRSSSPTGSVPQTDAAGGSKGQRGKRKAADEGVGAEGATNAKKSAKK